MKLISAFFILKDIILQTFEKKYIFNVNQYPVICHYLMFINRKYEKYEKGWIFSLPAMFNICHGTTVFYKE